MNSVSYHQYTWVPFRAVGLCACVCMCMYVHTSEANTCNMASPHFPLLATRSGVQHPGFLSAPTRNAGGQASTPHEVVFSAVRLSKWCLLDPPSDLPGNLGALMGYPSGTPGCWPPKGPTPVGTRNAKSGPSNLGQQLLLRPQPQSLCAQIE